MESSSTLVPDTAVLTDDAGQAQLIVTEQPTRASLKELALGVEGSTRRHVSFYIAAWLVATAVRNACFDPRVLGTYLSKNLAPVERDGVRWGWILAVRAWDLFLGAWIWKQVQGATRRDGALFGAIVAAASRASLYFFEHAYFLLSTETVSVIFFIDVLSLTAAFTLLPTLLPHSVSSRPTPSAWKRMERNPELVINIVIAFFLSVVLGALTAFVAERVGGTEFVKANAYDLEVPAVYAADTMTTAQMMAHPTISVHALRSLLRPQPMSWHVLHSFGIGLTTLFLTIAVLSRLTPLGTALTTFLLVAPPSTIMLWDVLPVTAIGALGVGTFLGLRAAIVSGIAAWVLEELRASRTVRRTTTVAKEHIDMVVVEEEEDGTEEVVALIEADVQVEEEVQVDDVEPAEVETSVRRRKGKSSGKSPRKSKRSAAAAAEEAQEEEQDDE